MKDYTVGRQKHELMPFFPHEFLRMVNMMLWALVIIFAIAIFGPEHQAEPADPQFTPPHIKPEWYFLGAYQFLRVIPNKLAGVVLQGLFMLFVLILPFLDRSSAGRRGVPTRRFHLIMGGFILVTVALTVWGHFS